MNEFNQVLRDEIDTVFLNPAEFGESISLDRKEITAVVDCLDTDPLAGSDPRPGLGLETVRLFICRDDLAGKYSQEQRVHYNGRRWHVLDVKEHQGVVELDLYRESV